MIEERVDEWNPKETKDVFIFRTLFDVDNAEAGRADRCS